ncbi:hypothetical protein fugu_017683 [Takifugu bimaculatus]|uniref:KASH domain-containing protein n=1 Tax=Takifugu bimaculatus TaxID=433685 RepID=A0A4Z2BRQ8_9TELE|nr:hypothetical protein fugu_017683 [Takifugu bimaculatus]
MEPEERVLDLAGREIAGGPAESYGVQSMLGMLSEIQTLVERSNIINRSPHIDLNWYLQFSSDEPEIRLARTVRRVLACRYQPAQLDLIAMAGQVREAEEFQCCVQDQVGAMKSMMATRVCDPDSLKRVEGQWGDALLDASATVHVKATQLGQVKDYHKKMKVIRAFLQVVQGEKDKMNLNSLGSSALQADGLQALLQTMEGKKGMLEELLCLGSQLSVHLSDSESSGALLAQLGDVQEEWRHLGSLKPSLKLCRSLDSEATDTFGYLCLRAELKLYNQLCLRFQAQLDSLTLISLGQKEKDETIHNLLDLKSLISVTKSKLDTSTYNCYGTLTAKANKQIQEWIEWAKQAENHIAVGPQLALFPEEAYVQIAEMKKFQSDFSSKRLKLRVESEQMKDVFMEKAEILQLWQATVGLYETVDKNLECILDTMKKNLEDREKLFFQLANMDAWLVEIVGKKDPYTHVDSISKADLGKLESELKSIKSSTVDLENHMKQLEAVMDSCREISPDLSPGESHYLVNRLSGLWAMLDGLVAHEKASCWELEELIFKRRSSEEELSNIQISLQQISVALEQERFPLSHETILTLEHLMHMLIEHQWEVQELQHCQETKRSSLLCTIGELQDKCKALSVNAYEQDKYLHLRKQMEESISITREQTQCVKATTVSVGERFRLCQTLLVELPLVKTQCQEAADQLEAIAQDLSPSELHSERQRIIQNVETLGSWEHSITEDIKYLENKILLGLDFSSEFPLFIEHLQKIRAELGGVEPVKPDEKVIDIKLQRCWVIWRNLECGVRVLEGLGQKEKIEKKNSKDLYALKSAAKHECQLRMESLSRARESLKDYHWAAQGAISFLHNAEATFLTAPGGFSDCTEEQKQTQQALEALEAGFQAHISHLSGLLPQQSCLSCPDTEELHISILSQLTVGRAIMEAQAQIRLESLQRCKMRQRGHKKCHEALGQLLSGLQTKLSEWAAEKTTSFEKCVGQQEAATLLMEDLRSVSTQIEELRAGCPMQGCGVGKGGELGALWRRWLCLRRGIGLLTAHAQQRANEWRDITASIKESRRCLNTLQADVLDTSTVSFTMVDPQELLGRAEMHQAALQVQQQALASLQHRMEQVLISSTSQEPLSPGPVGKTLAMSRESVVSLKERNLLVLAAAQAEEFREELSSQRAKLERIRERAQIRYPVIPADICRRLDEAHLSIQKEEERLTGKKNPVWKLDSQVAELESSLETVKVLLEQQSPTVDEAQHLLKHVWDKLDAWHSRLMLLENEVEDLAEDHPDQAHILVDQLTRPLQLYQNAAQMAEQRTAFLGKIPTCLQEFDGILYSATCWLEEAQSWLYAPCSFTTAKNLQNHANSLQLVLDDSERIRLVMQDFRAVLDDICSVCNMSWQKDRLQQSDQQVHKMQRTILEQLELFVQAVQEVEAMEEEVKTLDNNVAKIQAILSSVDNSSLSLREQQVILTNMASIRRTLEEVESCKGELHLPQGAEESLLIFSRAQQLLQTVQELEQLTEQQSMQLQSQEPGANCNVRSRRGEQELSLFVL